MNRNYLTRSNLRSIFGGGGGAKVVCVEKNYASLRRIKQTPHGDVRMKIRSLTRPDWEGRRGHKCAAKLMLSNEVTQRIVWGGDER